jgi:hypothetical protein
MFSQDLGYDNVCLLSTALLLGCKSLKSFDLCHHALILGSECEAQVGRVRYSDSRISFKVNVQCQFYGRGGSRVSSKRLFSALQTFGEFATHTIVICGSSAGASNQPGWLATGGFCRLRKYRVQAEWHNVCNPQLPSR